MGSEGMGRAVKPPPGSFSIAAPLAAAVARDVGMILVERAPSRSDSSSFSWSSLLTAASSAFCRVALASSSATCPW